ncbi:hypothetical protein PHLCEN_2v11581 [Hermanssonia centrifuga]|uniref:HSF-type DNA-binding domain-containing protein n=1 Tax=Hermanssonia centrifuga TaxID=98765 RepID=A0A2R6NK21_9APHY|nr:hypothetical protein PHLCEN_2v11581 [Hermanssonia centrifuga]
MSSSQLRNTRQRSQSQHLRTPPLSGSSGVDQSPDARDIAQYPTPPTPAYSLPPFSSITADLPIPFSPITWPTEHTDTRDRYLIAPATQRSDPDDEGLDCEALQAYVGFDEGPSSASDFVKKLYRILNDPTLAHIVTWGPRGDCLVVKDAHEFTNNILPGTFKHSNLASFVRQLNKYDFHKVKNEDDTESGERTYIFRHPDFYAGGWDALERIKRKVPVPKASSSATGDSSTSVCNTIDALQEKVDQTAWRQDELTAHIRNLETNYGSVMDSIIDIQGHMNQRDVLVQSLSQYLSSSDK